MVYLSGLIHTNPLRPCTSPSHSSTAKPPLSSLWWLSSFSAAPSSPELARGLGKAKREFKKASEEVEDEVRSAVEEDERKKLRMKQIEEEERAAVRAKLEAEERAKRAQDGKQN